MENHFDNEYGPRKVAWVANPVDELFMSPFLASVSYTHLRAHETVLDIVCRLLLEKKKTNIPTLI